MPLYNDGDYERVEPLKDEVTAKDKKIEGWRSIFRRDYGRVIHSSSFRRLQGKTQLFPVFESDFFRNRLTHSLEVAQIAKSIAIKINENEQFFKSEENKINLDIVEIASLTHDLGHPPFGHNGEKALNFCMKNSGCYEGNAQTLRILSKLEKRELKDGKLDAIEDEPGSIIDNRCGLNLTYRTMASIIKYDKKLPIATKETDPHKGYYDSESELVDDIKKNVLSIDDIKKVKKICKKCSVQHKEENAEGEDYGGFKTIECQIMDLADDIANATYDIEDSIKAKFITSFDLMNVYSKNIEKVKEKVNVSIKKEYGENETIEIYDAFTIIINTFKKQINDIMKDSKIHKKTWKADKEEYFLYIIKIIHDLYGTTATARERVLLSSGLIKKFINGITVKPNEEYPVLTVVKFEKETFKEVQFFKEFAFVNLIDSPMLKVAQFRGYDIVKEIFDSLMKEEGEKLLPDDFRELYTSYKNEELSKSRVICDFIAGMTDRYAVEFYERLKGVDTQSIYKPF